MQHRSRGSGAAQALFAYLGVCCVFAFGLLGNGCSSSREAVRRGNFTRVVTPRPPSFITSPAAALLTNWSGFSAYVDVQMEKLADTQRTASGQLLVRGSKLLYAPQTGESSDTRHRPGGYFFVWDVAEARGYIFSEALQGYAPVSSGVHVTNLSLETGAVAAQRFLGHPCDGARATLRLSDGTAAGFDLLRAIDLDGFPVRIESATNANVFTMSFSKIRFEQPPAPIFAPPDGFTPYPTPEAMADELAARQNSLKRKNPPDFQPLQPTFEQRGRY